MATMRGGAYFTAENGTDIFYTSEGSGGVPVLLLHGWVCDQNDWAFQIPLLLSLGFWVIGMDLRGHGHSFCSDAITDFDPVRLAEDAVALLAHLGIHGGDGGNNNTNNNTQQAIVMGHSLGAVVANEMAFRHGRLVRGMVLVDAGWYMTPAAMSQLRQTLQEAGPAAAPVAATDYFDAAGLYPAGRTPAWLVPFHRRRAWAMRPRVVAAAFEQLAAHLGESGVAYLRRTRGRTSRTSRIPKLITCAENASAELEREAGIDGRRDRVEVIPAGHFHHIIEPDRFNGVLRDWLVEREYANPPPGDKVQTVSL